MCVCAHVHVGGEVGSQVAAGPGCQLCNAWRCTRTLSHAKPLYDLHTGALTQAEVWPPWPMHTGRQETHTSSRSSVGYGRERQMSSSLEPHLDLLHAHTLHGHAHIHTDKLTSTCIHGHTWACASRHKLLDRYSHPCTHTSTHRHAHMQTHYTCT